MLFLCGLRAGLRIGFYTSTRSLCVAPSQQKVGFIGLGNMGGFMAANLLKAGHSVTVFDINKDSMRRLEQHGARVGQTVQDVGRDADTVVTMLPSSPHVLDVYTGENGLLESVRSGTLLVDASTIHPSVSRDIAALAEAKQLAFVDAPVSGGVGGAEKATLTFMVGGSESGFARSMPLLRVMGRNIVHCGGPGTGQVAKVCNNMLLGISMVGVAETMNLGVSLGMDPLVLAKIINSSSGRCWSSDTYNPVPGVMEGVPSARDYEGGFGSALMLKDLGLALDGAQSQKVATPLASLAQQIYTFMCSRGYAKKDFSSVYHFLGETKQ